MAIDTIGTNALATGAVNTSKIAAGAVDDSTIEIASNQLQLKDGGITNAKVNASAGIVTTKISGLDAQIDNGLGRLENEIGLLNVNRLIDNGAALDDFVKGFSDAFTDETGVNTGVNTNTTYSTDNDTYGASVIVNTLGFAHKLNSSSNWTAYDATRLAYYSFGQYGGNGMSMATTSYGGNIRSSIYTPSVASSVTGTDLVRWTMNDTENNGGVGIYLASAQSHVRLTANASLAGGWSNSSSHWASGDPEVGGLKGMFVQFGGSGNYYVYNVKGANSSSGQYSTSDVMSWHRASDGTITLRKNGVDTGANVNANGSFTGDWRVVVNHAGEGSTIDFTSLEIKENVPTGSTDAGVFQTAAQTAVSQPDTVRLVLLGKEEQTQTLNTDTVFSISRDGGTTFSAITMTQSGNYNSSGVKIYTGTVDVSGQPTGTSVVLKVTTTATKGFTLHGYSLLYK